MEVTSHPQCPHCRKQVKQVNRLKAENSATISVEAIRSEWHCEICGNDFAPDYFEWAPYGSQ